MDHIGEFMMIQGALRQAQWTAKLCSPLLNSFCYQGRNFSVPQWLKEIEGSLSGLTHCGSDRIPELVRALQHGFAAGERVNKFNRTTDQYRSTRISPHLDPRESVIIRGL